nr:MAG TPA: hypothetical protein [Caudoviricetes sp.]
MSNFAFILQTSTPIAPKRHFQLHFGTFAFLLLEFSADVMRESLGRYTISSLETYWLSFQGISETDTRRIRNLKINLAKRAKSGMMYLNEL